MSHPAVLAIVTVLAIALLVSIIKKIIKVALVLLIIMLLAGGAIYHAASDAIKMQGERILNDVKKQFDTN